jgi:SM-20-related protein
MIAAPRTAGRGGNAAGACDGRSDMAIDTTQSRAGATAARATAAAIVDAIAAAGLAVVRDAIPAALVAAWRSAAGKRDAAGEFRAAGVGRAAARTERAEVRGDRIRWLDRAEATPAETALFAFVETLCCAVNEALYLGLLDFEGHYALYPPGGRYARHLDRFRDDDARVLTLILYLNDGWTDAYGGCLRIALADGTTRDVRPDGGTLVAFLSERFPHEVLPATRERLAFTGWYRRRA